MARLGERIGHRLRRLGEPWELACFLWIPAIVTAFTAWFELRSATALGDFPIFRAASRAVLHGRSPYAVPNAHALANFDTFVYPPVAAWVFAPLAVVPYSLAKVIILVLSAGSVILALRLLRVVDWRCYGVAAASMPVVNSIALGAYSTFLVLGAAVAWRYRDTERVSSVVAGLTATVKLFLWPLGLWLLVTRRFRAFVVFAATAVVLVVAGWAAIGFAGFRAYPHLLRVLSQVEAHRSFSLVALFRVSGTGATVLSAVLAVALMVALAIASKTADGDRLAFSLAVLGPLLVTPVIWMHYYALLFVPIALYRPRLSALWLAPVGLWLVPSTYSEGVPWRILLGLGAVAVVGLCAFGLEAQNPWRLRRGARQRPDLPDERPQGAMAAVDSTT